MGVVFRTRDFHHPRKVAIKVLRPEIASAVGPERFQREIHIEEQLQHLTASLPVERIRLAELYFAVREHSSAHATAASFDGEAIVNLPFLPASLNIRANAADALARPDLSDRELKLIMRCLTDGPRSFATAPLADSVVLVMASMSLASNGARLDCAEAGYRRLMEFTDSCSVRVAVMTRHFHMTARAPTAPSVVAPHP